ncbi:hypothetical protein Tco_0017621 [Tanacetum coccineum]
MKIWWDPPVAWAKDSLSDASPASIPQRHVAGDSFPQRHVAGESPDMSPGKRAIVVVKVVSWRKYLHIRNESEGHYTLYVELEPEKSLTVCIGRFVCRRLGGHWGVVDLGGVRTETNGATTAFLVGMNAVFMSSIRMNVASVDNDMTRSYGLRKGRFWSLPKLRLLESESREFDVARCRKQLKVRMIDFDFSKSLALVCASKENIVNVWLSFVFDEPVLSSLGGHTGEKVIASGNYNGPYMLALYACIEYEWIPPMYSSWKVFGHVVVMSVLRKDRSRLGEECCVWKSSRQAARGVLVGPKVLDEENDTKEIA